MFLEPCHVAELPKRRVDSREPRTEELLSFQIAEELERACASIHQIRDQLCAHRFLYLCTTLAGSCTMHGREPANQRRLPGAAKIASGQSNYRVAMGTYPTLGRPSGARRHDSRRGG